jgi:Tol biopolymer transport system component
VGTSGACVRSGCVCFVFFPPLDESDAAANALFDCAAVADSRFDAFSRWEGSGIHRSAAQAGRHCALGGRGRREWGASPGRYGGCLLPLLGWDVPARYANRKLSPDGKRVAVDIDDPQSFNTDIWILESGHSEPRRLTFDPSQDEAPLWSHDGRRILWLSDRGGKNNFYVKAADGSGVEQSVTASVPAGLSFASTPSDWSSDERFLLYTDMHEGTGLHLWVLPMTGAPPYRFVVGAAADVEGQFSPDCRWVAYSSNESGRWEVYVAHFPRKEGKYQISIDGGQQPRWRRDGKELFFLSRDRELMGVSVKVGEKFEFTAPTALFETQAHEPITGEEFFTYDASADGQSFLINVNKEQNNPPPVDIILNWASQLTK